MTLALAAVRRIAEEAVRSEDPALEVVGATAGEGGAYTEVTVTIHGCEEEPCRMVIGTSRDADESAVRSAIASRVREHNVRRNQRPNVSARGGDSRASG